MRPCTRRPRSSPGATCNASAEHRTRSATRAGTCRARCWRRWDRRQSETTQRNPAHSKCHLDTRARKWSSAMLFDSRSSTAERSTEAAEAVGACPLRLRRASVCSVTRPE
eukprot:Amastigsp_a510135_16.p6 type:complete len:110 gc:universal Amastigsp_a510135_16:624-295(-)